MSNLINFENQSINTVLINGEIFFHATELARALGFGNPHQAIASHVDKDDLQKLETIDTIKRTQKVNFVNESGMYALIFGSTKDEAKRFKRWVTSEVLPTIRKTGSYHQSTPADRTPLRQAVSMLVGKKRIGYDEAYYLVHQYMGVNHIDEIALDDLPKAVAYVHSLMFHSSKELYNVLCGSFEHLRDYAKIARLMNAAHSEQIEQLLLDIYRIGKQMTNRHNRPMFEQGRMNYYQGNAMILK